MNMFNDGHTEVAIFWSPPRTIHVIYRLAARASVFQCDQNNFKLQLRRTLLENGLTLTWHGCAQSSSGAQSLFPWGMSCIVIAQVWKSTPVWVDISHLTTISPSMTASRDIVTPKRLAVFWFGNWMFTNSACQYSQGFSDSFATYVVNRDIDLSTLFTNLAAKWIEQGRHFEAFGYKDG